MALTFVQTDSAGFSFDADTNKFCTSASLAPSGSSVANVLCTVGGTAGTSAHTGQNLGAEAANTLFYGINPHPYFELTVDSGVSWNAGTWTVRVNITTSNMNITIETCSICRLNSANVNQATIGEATSLAISCSTTGVKTIDVTGTAQSPAAGDKVLILLAGSNSSMSAQSVGFTRGENIDTPFTVVTSSLLWDQLAAIRPHLVRKVRDFFLGGLPPKLAKLRMVKHGTLWLPRSDPQLRKAA